MGIEYQTDSKEYRDEIARLDKELKALQTRRKIVLAQHLNERRDALAMTLYAESTVSDISPEDRRTIWAAPWADHSHGKLDRALFRNYAAIAIQFMAEHYELIPRHILVSTDVPKPKKG